MRDHALSEHLQRSLGEGWTCRAQTVKHHLPPQVDNGQFYRFRIRCSHVSLKQHDHTQKGRWMRLFSRTSVPVHLRELFLERVIEQFVSMLSQKPEEWPYTMEALQ
jgi:hypothetical protein